MRLITRLSLVPIVVAVGCNREPKLTPEQAQQVEAARLATVATSERLLGRQLTDDEKACIKVEWQDDRPLRQGGSAAQRNPQTTTGRANQGLTTAVVALPQPGETHNQPLLWTGPRRV